MTADYIQKPQNNQTPPKKRTRPTTSPRRIVGAAVALSALVSCRDTGVFDAPMTRAEITWFTADIAAQIDKNGQLPGVRPGGVDESEISPARAIELAALMHHDFGAAQQSMWSQDAGYTIRAADLRQCGRVDFVEHPYSALPLQASPSFKARVGPKWLVRYCAASSIPVVEYYVSAQGLSSALDSTGRFLTNTPITAVKSRAINRAVPAAETSEDAAGESFRRSRKQIERIPIMVLVGKNTVPWVLSWSVKQVDTPPGITATVAYPLGNPRKWVVRESPDTTTEADTLEDGGVTPSKMYVLRRRPSAAKHEDVRQILGLEK
jgi:hypothetical protein